MTAAEVSKMPKTDIMGLLVDNVNMSDALDFAENALERDVPSLVFTPNAEIACACAKDGNLLKLINSAELTLPDGVGILIAAKALDVPLKERVAGVDFGEKLAELCSGMGKSIYILGGKPGVAESAAEKLKQKYSGLKISGTRDGYFDKSVGGAKPVVSDINKSGANVLYVCLGFPAQEKWAAEHKGELSTVRLVACLGGSVDIYSGNAKRAPKLFIRMKCEWLWRLLKNPSRLTRMTALPEYMRLIRKYKRQRKSK